MAAVICIFVFVYSPDTAAANAQLSYNYKHKIYETLYKHKLNGSIHDRLGSVRTWWSYREADELRNRLKLPEKFMLFTSVRESRIKQELARINFSASVVSADQHASAIVAMSAGDFSKLYGILKQELASADLSDSDAAVVNFVLGLIAEHNVDWFDAAMYFSAAVSHVDNIEYLYYAQLYLYNTGRYEESIRYGNKLIESAVAKYGYVYDPYDKIWWKGSSWQTLALYIQSLAYNAQGKESMSVKSFEQASDIRRYEDIDYEDAAKYHYYARQLDKIASLYIAQGIQGRAFMLYDIILDKLSSLSSSWWDLRELQQNNAAMHYINHNDIGNHAVYVFEFDTAEKSYYLDVIADISADQTLFAEHFSQYIAATRLLAKLYYDYGKHHNAEKLYMNAMERVSEVFDSCHPYYFASKGMFADYYTAIEQYSDAERLYDEIAASATDSCNTDMAERSAFLQWHADFYARVGKYKQAEQLYRKALAIDKEILGNNHPGYIANLGYFANFLFENYGLTPVVEKIYQDVTETAKYSSGGVGAAYAYSLSHAADIYTGAGREDNILDYYFINNDYVYNLHIEALDTYREIYGEGHPSYINALDTTVEFLLRAGKNLEATELYRKFYDYEDNDVDQASYKFRLIDLIKLRNLYMKTQNYVVSQEVEDLIETYIEDNMTYDADNMEDLLSLEGSEDITHIFENNYAMFKVHPPLLRMAMRESAPDMFIDIVEHGGETEDETDILWLDIISSDIISISDYYYSTEKSIKPFHDKTMDVIKRNLGSGHSLYFDNLKLFMDYHNGKNYGLSFEVNYAYKNDNNRYAKVVNALSSPYKPTHDEGCSLCHELPGRYPPRSSDYTTVATYNIDNNPNMAESLFKRAMDIDSSSGTVSLSSVFGLAVLYQRSDRYDDIGKIFYGNSYGDSISNYDGGAEEYLKTNAGEYHKDYVSLIRVNSKISEVSKGDYDSKSHGWLDYGLLYRIVNDNITSRFGYIDNHAILDEFLGNNNFDYVYILYRDIIDIVGKELGYNHYLYHTLVYRLFHLLHVHKPDMVYAVTDLYTMAHENIFGDASAHILRLDGLIPIYKWLEYTKMHEASEKYFLAAVDWAKSNSGINSLPYADMVWSLGDFYTRQERYADAISLYEEAAAVYGSNLMEKQIYRLPMRHGKRYGDFFTHIPSIELANAYNRVHRYEEAERITTGIIESKSQSCPRQCTYSHSRHLLARLSLADTYESQGKYDEAYGVVRTRETSDWEIEYCGKYPHFVDIYLNLGMARLTHGGSAHMSSYTLEGDWNIWYYDTVYSIVNAFVDKNALGKHNLFSDYKNILNQAIEFYAEKGESEKVAILKHKVAELDYCIDVYGSDGNITCLN